MEEPDFDEEDRSRWMITPNSHPPSESFYGRATSEANNLLRIKVLKDVEDPILMADGSEVVLKGDIETCPSLIAEILIAAGLAEAARFSSNY